MELENLLYFALWRQLEDRKGVQNGEKYFGEAKKQSGTDVSRRNLNGGIVVIGDVNPII